MKNACAVTIGFFDGIHRGHRFLLQQLKELAEAEGLSAVAITFDQHPKCIIGNSPAPSLLTTLEEKLDLLTSNFDGEVVVLPFTQELCALTAKEFMHSQVIALNYKRSPKGCFGLSMFTSCSPTKEKALARNS